MKYGSYFEYLCLGGGSGKSADVTDLPRLESGAKSTLQKRIEVQARKFSSMFNPESSEFVGTPIRHKQLNLVYGEIEGTIDMDLGFPSDLKLTADLNTEYSYWSDPAKLDNLQAATYVYLYSNRIEPTNKFSYWVFDYSTQMNILNVDIVVTDEAIQKMLKRFADAESLVSQFEATEWPKIPSVKDCRWCKLDCDKRINKAGYNQIKITI